jgi:hypothetical protein
MKTISIQTSAPARLDRARALLTAANGLSLSRSRPVWDLAQPLTWVQPVRRRQAVAVCGKGRRLQVSPARLSVSESLLMALLVVAAAAGVIYGLACSANLLRDWGAFSNGISLLIR